MSFFFFQYEPIITPGNELNVHHILIYHCSQDINPAQDGKTFECYTYERPQALQSCYLVFIAWAIGGGVNFINFIIIIQPHYLHFRNTVQSVLKIHIHVYERHIYFKVSRIVSKSVSIQVSTCP